MNNDKVNFPQNIQIETNDSSMSVFCEFNIFATASLGIILGMGSANERWRCYVTPSLIGRALI